MNNRIYNKLYINKNREDTSENLKLGYQHEEREIVLKKNQETSFHIPAYTTPILLTETNLIANGAVAGAFPAASDRIFKSLKNYGNQTQHGSPTASIADGTWFCSWLYKNPTTGIVQWIDRFYNPGKFDYSVATNELLEQPPYIKLDPIFRDIPSQMVLEPGVLYRYFHQGETSFDNLLTTFEGNSSEHLKLHLLNWGQDQVDRSLNQIPVIINSQAPYDTLYPKVNVPKKNINPIINFTYQFNTECYLNYDSSYTPTNEFTWTCWSYSDNWQNNVSTQLIGNFSTRGGVGIFLDTLETYPYITIPETTYGHVLMINQFGTVFTDKFLQKNNAPVNPCCFAIDSNDHVIVCNKDSSGVISKMDHTGQIIRTTKNIADPSTLFVFSSSGELPKQVICGKNDDFYVITNQSVYVFDNNLKLKQTLPQVIGNNTKAAFAYDIKKDTDELVLTDNVFDVKFVENVKWTINTDGHLYKDSVLMQEFADEASAMSIAPDGNIWILHGNSGMSIFSTIDNTIIKRANVGFYVDRTGAKRNISFIKRINPFGVQQWYCLLFYSKEKRLYFYDLDMDYVSSTDLSSLFSRDIIQKFKQNPNNFSFLSEGDFTGYERKRIFNQLSPYNNKPQIVIKASAKDLSKDGQFYTIFKKHFPIADWNENSWQHLVLTYKNKIFELWSNAHKLTTLRLGGQHEIVYEMQPLFFIGSPTGNSLGFNTELKRQTCIFNGKIGDIRIYDYAMQTPNIDIFVKACVVSEDLYWPMNIPLTQYVEQIERMFKHKLPGAKSNSLI